MSTIFDIADAVVEALNGQAFSKSFKAELKAIPEYDITKSHGLLISVMPRELDITQEMRGESQWGPAIDVGIQKKIEAAGDPVTEVRELTGLVEEIASFLMNEDFELSPTRIENKPVYAGDHLRNHRVFTSVLTLRYLTLKVNE